MKNAVTVRDVMLSGAEGFTELNKDCLGLLGRMQEHLDKQLDQQYKKLREIAELAVRSVLSRGNVVINKNSAVLASAARVLAENAATILAKNEKQQIAYVSGLLGKTGLFAQKSAATPVAAVDQKATVQNGRRLK